MKLLDAADNGVSCTTGAKVRFINDPYSPSSYFTVNGNEESCGSSFSELESTWLMEEAKEESGGACGVIEEAARGGGFTWRQSGMMLRWRGS
ncbi:uncharacterized protein Pyn_02824 [Prunus yedoensis var. nudiflora]|uniref:Uncharacterized protein n=1 Tax=Prunus yedoensis var. nudiflora TaxID=2094558 RepID=A0A314Z681_PRUYE|nr:uncharacterized protein Pyn_02824 [Prunus yedoensis var. nudiflora]